MQGTYAVTGAPVQQFKVTLNKQPVVEGMKSPEEIEALGLDGIMQYHMEIARKREKLPKIIPETLSQASQTPLLLNLAGGESSLHVEISDYPME